MAIEYDPKKREYQQSDAVTKAQEMLQNQLANKPGAYQSQWQSQLNDVMDKILNREKFTYGLNGDALYKQYKDQYTNQGKMAMMDTMGQAAAMTGGYGNSYAQNVGQQAYQGYLQQLNDKIPELYNLALSKYQMEGDDLARQYSMLGDRESTDYGRYRDTVSDYNSELSRLQSAYDTERSFDYGQFVDDRNYQYQQNSDRQKLAQAQVDYLISIGGKVSDELLAAAGYDPSYLSSINDVRAAQAAAAAASSSGGGGRRKKKDDITEEDFLAEVERTYRNKVEAGVPAHGEKGTDAYLKGAISTLTSGLDKNNESDKEKIDRIERAVTEIRHSRW